VAQFPYRVNGLAPRACDGVPDLNPRRVIDGDDLVLDARAATQEREEALLVHHLVKEPLVGEACIVTLDFGDVIVVDGPCPCPVTERLLVLDLHLISCAMASSEARMNSAATCGTMLLP
jgi:hypothetical protein